MTSPSRKFGASAQPAVAENTGMQGWALHWLGDLLDQPAGGVFDLPRRAFPIAPVLALARELTPLVCIDPALLATLATFVPVIVTAPTPTWIAR